MDSFKEGFENAANDPSAGLMVQRAMESCPAKTVLSLGAGEFLDLLAVSFFFFFLF